MRVLLIVKNQLPRRRNLSNDIYCTFGPHIFYAHSAFPSDSLIYLFNKMRIYFRTDFSFIFFPLYTKQFLNGFIENYRVKSPHF